MRNFLRNNDVNTGLTAAILRNRVPKPKPFSVHFVSK
jgi:hypothetical protein